MLTISNQVFPRSFYGHRLRMVPYMLVSAGDVPNEFARGHTSFQPTP